MCGLTNASKGGVNTSFHDIIPCIRNDLFLVNIFTQNTNQVSRYIIKRCLRHSAYLEWYILVSLGVYYAIMWIELQLRYDTGHT